MCEHHVRESDAQLRRLTSEVAAQLKLWLNATLTTLTVVHLAGCMCADGLERGAARHVTALTARLYEVAYSS